MSEPLDLVDLHQKFERITKAYTGKSMMQHIPMELKKVGDYLEKIEKMMPLDKFKNYFVKMVNGFHKVVGKDKSDMVYGVEYSISKDV